ncbi:hypothetical protein FE257_006260 [Aspergillus nanangensis]|uniref:Uncharacterized protein n=1 Tax=Aspergillus nanangensis TaxID=2582783 RepID=A0AAD4GTZ4_ASPNN|nr:hypothetical protein FE257_006260 [Aspergillus nanangensis]
MLISCATLLLLSAVRGVNALASSNLVKHVDVLALDYPFNPVKPAYWTGYPHHRRTPFAVSPDEQSAYVAYLDNSETGVHVQSVDPQTFAAKGSAITISGAKEAGGLVAHNDGFALLTNEAMPSSTANSPPDGTPVPVMYRYTDGKQTWKTWLGGPDVHPDDGLSMSPDLNGDLVYSEEAGLYGAYFVVTDYAGWASGHFGDSVQYIAKDGTLRTITDASSSWGCSHNTGIAFEAADAAPFASICAEDQGAIWLNTNNRGMSNTGVKISNENTTNGASGEPMGGMSGSYSSLARFQQSTNYIFSWVSRGASEISENTWMGDGYTNSQNRTNNRNVAIALFSDKYTKVGAQATSVVGSSDGDSQVNWVTSGNNDCSNAHVATFGPSNALVSWEEISDPICDFVAMGCRGDFAGSFFQQVDASGKKVGQPLKSLDTYVAGDMVTMTDGRICWPYISMDWDLSGGVDGTSGSSTKKMSFACLSIDGVKPPSSSVSSATATTKVSASTFVTEVRPSTVEATVPTSSAPSTDVDVTSSIPPATSTVDTEISIISTSTIDIEHPVVSTRISSTMSAVPIESGNSNCPGDNGFPSHSLSGSPGPHSTGSAPAGGTAEPSATSNAGEVEHPHLKPTPGSMLQFLRGLFRGLLSSRYEKTSNEPNTGIPPLPKNM